MDLHTAIRIVEEAAGRNDAIARLYASVDARSKISIVLSTARHWSCTVTPHGTKIAVAPSSYPAESLYHELLHADLELKGCRPCNAFVRIVEGDMVPFIAMAVCNELHHHRMYKDFLIAGFDSSRFYHDADADTLSSIRSELKRMPTSSTTAGAYFVKYLSVVAPGGIDSEIKRERLKRFFYLHVPSDKMTRIEAAADRLVSWGASSDMDVVIVTRDILKILGEFEGWWIGSSAAFPGGGHFVGSDFSYMEAMNFAGYKQPQHI